MGKKQSPVYFDDDEPSGPSTNPVIRQLVAQAWKEATQDRKREPGRRLTGEELASGKY